MPHNLVQNSKRSSFAIYAPIAYFCFRNKHGFASSLNTDAEKRSSNNVTVLFRAAVTQ